MSEEEKLSYSEAIKKAGAAITRFPLKPVKGVPLMCFIANNWDSIWAFRPDPSDILIATYPKAGTTWTQEIVDLLLHNGDAEACKRAPTPIRSPFLEIFSPPPIPSGLDLLKTMDPPRIIKTHLSFQLVPPSYLLSQNPRREVERIMKYLELSVSDEVISRIVELTSFKNMKKNPMANYSCIPETIFDKSISHFMRKGEVGDWKNYFTTEQSKTFDEDYEKQMKGVNIPFRTLI